MQAQRDQNKSSHLELDVVRNESGDIDRALSVVNTDCASDSVCYCFVYCMYKRETSNNQ